MMMGEAVGRDRMGTAMALDVGACNASRMVGPTVGGLLLAGIGIEGALLLSALLYASPSRRRSRCEAASPPTPGAGAVLARTWEAMRIVVADRRLAATMVVTIIYNVFAWPFTSMIPVIGRDRLLLGPEGVGMLTSVDGVGAFAGALLLAMWLTPGWHARAYVGGVAVYLLAVIGFALSPPPALAGTALLLTGLAAPPSPPCRRHRLSRGADRDALAHPGRPVGLHRHRPDRLRLAGLARRPHRRAACDGVDRRHGPAGARRDLAVVAADIGPARAQRPLGSGRQNFPIHSTIAVRVMTAHGPVAIRLHHAAQA